MKRLHLVVVCTFLFGLSSMLSSCDFGKKKEEPMPTKTMDAEKNMHEAPSTAPEQKPAP